MRGIPIIWGHFANFANSPTLETPNPEPIERKQFIDSRKLNKQKQTNKQLAINTNTYEEHSRPLGRGKYHLAVIMTLENKTSIKWM